MEILSQLKVRFVEDRVSDLSAQLAYYLLLSFFPFLLLAFTLLGYISYTSAPLLFVVRSYIPEDAYFFIQNNLVQMLNQKKQGVLTISIVATIYPASLVFQSTLRMLNQVYRVSHWRPFWKRLLLGVFFLTGLLGMFMLSLVLPIVEKLLIRNWMTVSWLWFFIRWMMSSLLLFFIFLCLYKIGPNVKVKYIQAIPGAFFSTIGWQLMSFVFSNYVSTFGNYSLIYGNLGAMIVLVVWFYLSAMILVMGGQLNAIYLNK